MHFVNNDRWEGHFAVEKEGFYHYTIEAWVDHLASWEHEITLKIRDTQHVNSEISKVKGIVAFQTSYENANSTVKFDNSKTSVDSIAAVINSTGYKVVSQTVTNN